MVIERGTFQLGLITMNSISSENSGVRWSGTFLPMTERVWNVILPWSTIRALKSVRLTQTWRDPRSKFIQRSRSIATMTDCRRASGATLISSIVLGARDAVGRKAVQELELFDGARRGLRRTRPRR